ncbi:hypothetical protein EVAR_43289_1 [Eumeta japonica]|uniref:BESS domain-containing protein n=1 Tax=Eumeta variegata TaxID=151549 RepID=A0A4C1WZS0_EUMVA|nr:hypothetical protein EVAR_43289_1 [Eumeta japonica]
MEEDEEEEIEYEKNENKRSRYQPIPRKRKVIDEIDSEILRTLKETENRHLSFFKAILPSLNKLDDHQTLIFQSRVLQILTDFHQIPYQYQTPTGYHTASQDSFLEVLEDRTTTFITNMTQQAQHWIYDRAMTLRMRYAMKTLAQSVRTDRTRSVFELRTAELQQHENRVNSHVQAVTESVEGMIVCASRFADPGSSIVATFYQGIEIIKQKVDTINVANPPLDCETKELKLKSYGALLTNLRRTLEQGLDEAMENQREEFESRLRDARAANLLLFSGIEYSSLCILKNKTNHSISVGIGCLMEKNGLIKNGEWVRTLMSWTKCISESCYFASAFCGNVVSSVEPAHLRAAVKLKIISAANKPMFFEGGRFSPSEASTFTAALGQLDDMVSSCSGRLEQAFSERRLELLLEADRNIANVLKEWVFFFF